MQIQVKDWALLTQDLNQVGLILIADLSPVELVLSLSVAAQSSTQSQLSPSLA